MGFLKKSVAFGVPPAYSRYRRLRPRGEKLVDFVLTSKGFEMSKSVITYSRNCF